MSNALNMDLTGLAVVVKASFHNAEHQSIPDRLFRVEGGFGARPDTAGLACMGVYLKDGEEARVEGWAVERLATEDDLKLL